MKKLLAFLIMFVMLFGNIIRITPTTKATERPVADYTLTQNPYGDDKGEGKFIIVVKIDEKDKSYSMPRNIDYTYNFDIEWGDGNKDTNVILGKNHNYENPGIYEIRISGDFPEFSSELFKGKILDIKQWGDIKWKSFKNAFYLAKDLIGTYTDAPNLEGVEDMSGMFEGAEKFNGSMEGWDTRNVTNMRNMFKGATSFNQPVNFDTRNVTDMINMFKGATSFNQPINFENTENLSRVSSMFNGAENFNQPVKFGTNNITDMSNMFEGAISFNQPVNFDTRNAEDMSNMFKGATSFNQPINFDTINVLDMSDMFYGATSFNQPLNFDTRNVIDMNKMFFGAKSFDKDISNFNIGKLGKFSSYNTMTEMFKNAKLSTENYDKLLISFGKQQAFYKQENRIYFDGGDSVYCSAEAKIARKNLIEKYNWSITDKGSCDQEPIVEGENLEDLRNKLKEKIKEGDGKIKEEYKEKSWEDFELILTESKGKKDSNVKEELKGALYKLTKALEDLEKNKKEVGTEIGENLEDLRNKLKEKIKEGDGKIKEEYKEKSWEDFELILTESKGKKDSNVKEELKGALYKLTKALEDLEKNKKEVGTETGENLEDLRSKLKEKIKEGDGKIKEEYKEKSWEDFKLILTESKEKKDSNVKEELKGALDKLTKALEDLEKNKKETNTNTNTVNNNSFNVENNGFGNILNEKEISEIIKNDSRVFTNDSNSTKREEKVEEKLEEAKKIETKENLSDKKEEELKTLANKFVKKYELEKEAFGYLNPEIENKNDIEELEIPLFSAGSLPKITVLPKTGLNEVLLFILSIFFSSFILFRRKLSSK